MRDGIPAGIGAALAAISIAHADELRLLSAASMLSMVVTGTFIGIIARSRLLRLVRELT